MKKSELTAFIKEEIVSALTFDEYKDLFNKYGVEVTEDKQTQQDIKDTEELTKAIDNLAKAKEEAGLTEIGGSSRERLNDLAQNIGREEFAMNVLEIPDENVLDMLADELAKLYDMSDVIKEEEDAPAGDAEIEKKASKQDIIIKNYDRLRKELKSHLKDYQSAKDEAEKQKHLNQMKKISQSAEYLDAKAKYEKLKQVK